MLLGLTVSVALAGGYLAGRLHAALSAPQGAGPMMATVTNSSEANDAPAPLRPSLNPSPVRVEARARTTTVSGGFERHASSQRQAAVITTAAAEPYPARHIGDHVDPDAYISLGEVEPRHIGEHVDPDGYLQEANAGAPISIGEHVDPDSIPPRT